LPPLWAVSLGVEMTRTIELPGPACAQVRGLLGERLRLLRCLTGAPRCEGCPEIAQCDFARVFDAGQHDQGTPPFWLQGIPARSRLDAGERFEARLVVLGSESHTLPYLEAALRDAWQRLGRPPHQANATPWKPAATLQACRSTPLVTPALPPASCWRLSTCSPLVLRDRIAEGSPACPAVPALAQILSAARRRLYRLHRAQQGGGTWPAMDLPDLTAIGLVAGEFRPWSAARYSHRQERTMPLEGLVGEIEIEGEALLALSPLLDVLPLISVGKNTAMGLGDIQAIRSP
jgi:hypothetical protein